MWTNQNCSGISAKLSQRLNYFLIAICRSKLDKIFSKFLKTFSISPLESWQFCGSVSHDFIFWWELTMVQFWLLTGLKLGKRSVVWEMLEKKIVERDGSSRKLAKWKVEFGEVGREAAAEASQPGNFICYYNNGEVRTNILKNCVLMSCILRGRSSNLMHLTFIWLTPLPSQS